MLPPFGPKARRSTTGPGVCRCDIVTGKGGVGKSVLAVGLAVAAARRGEKVLLATTGGRDDLSPLLGCAPLGDSLREVVQRVWAVAMTGESTRIEHAVQVLRFERVARLVFKNPLVRTLLDFVPALNEVNQLGKLRWHAAGNGPCAFDRIVLEAPASGHAISLLKAPILVGSVAAKGPMHRETQSIVEWLRDPDATRVHLVTQATDMSCREAEQLARALRAKVGIEPACLWVNRAPLPPPAASSIADLSGDGAAAYVAAGAVEQRRADRVAEAAAVIGLPAREIGEYDLEGTALIDQVAAAVEGWR
jgi:hypothetical protein